MALETREREQVDLAEVEFTPGDWSRDAAPLRYVALRFTPRQSELFAAKGSRYHAIVSNRADLEAADLVRWHRQKAGTIEHVHRVMKDELAAGVLPGARFGANAAWFRIQRLRVQRADGAQATRPAAALPRCASEAPPLRAVHASGQARDPPEPALGPNARG